MKVERDGPHFPWMPSRCWEWSGCVDRAGYPKFWLHGNAMTAQRARFVLAGEPLRSWERAVPLCTNRRCVRPEHLVRATLREAHALRCRGSSGCGPGDLLLIRRIVREGSASVEVMAEAFELRPEFVAQLAALDPPTNS